MANNENLMPIELVNSRRTREQHSEDSKKGGKASGESRRRKADFRKTLNMLLTAKIDNPEWEPILESLGVEPTLESAMLMSQIKEAIAGNTKAAYFVAQYAGQSDKTERDLEEQRADIELKKARKQVVTGENETDEALNKLDAILKEVHNNAVKQQAE